MATSEGSVSSHGFLQQRLSTLSTLAMAFAILKYIYLTSQTGSDMGFGN